MKIAIPIWEDKLSPVLDTASRLLIVDEEDGRETSRCEIFLNDANLSRRCLQMKGLGVDLLICGAVSRACSSMLASEGITVIQEIAGRTEEVLGAYLKGELLHSNFFMPGCRRSGPGQCTIDGAFRRRPCERSKRGGRDDGFSKDMNKRTP